MNSSLKIYSASAGSGKTFTLAKEFISLLVDNPENYKNTLAVTFTVKATGEMKERILQNLNKIANNSANNSDSQLISDQKTLHPDLTVDEIKIRAKKALNNILNDFSQFNILTIDGFVQKVIRAFAFEANLPSHYEITLDKQEVVAEAITELYANLKTDKELEKWLWRYTQESMEESQGWNLERKINDICEELIDKRDRVDTKTLTMSELHSFVDHINKIIREEKDNETKNYHTALSIKKNIYTTGLWNYIKSNIEKITRDESLMLISESNNLLEKLISGSDVPFIYEKVGSRFENIMIDEFQDTSKVQWKNFLPLVKNTVDNGKMALIVGDVKQAIYRWRNSDWNLLAKDVREEFKGRYEDKTLDTNYRSEAGIIEYNNDLFKKIVNKYTNEHPQIVDLYKDVHQEISEKRKADKKGYVKIRKLTYDEGKNIRLKELLATINDLREKGYKYSDMCILVRGNNEGGEIAQFLTENGVNVLSSESLLLDSSPVVQAILSAMRYINNEQNQVALAYLKDFQEDITQEMLINLRGMSLIDMTAEIINLFDEKWVEHQLIYVDAFRNVVYNFTSKNKTNLSDFLEYYDSQKVYVESTPSDDDIQLMTIHKAKGLEFPIVLMPYLDWDLFKLKKLSVKDLPAPFDALDSYLLDTKDIEKTVANSQYEAEIELQLIDNINLLYVALTRPKIAFYGWAAKPNSEKRTIYDLVEETEQGILPPKKEENNKPQATLNITTNLKATPWNSRNSACGPSLNKHFGHIAFTDKTKDGTAKHAIMEKIITLGDIEKYTKRAVINGDMDEKESIDFINEVAQEIKNLNIEKWFNGTMTIFTETAMISDYYERRPDRIMVDGDNNATVLDYKFYKSVDTETPKKHEIQVNNYIQMLKRTNLFNKINGYLWYYNQRELVEVR